MDEERIAKAADSMKRGGFCVIFDGEEREGEADLCIHAQYAKSETVRTLRKDAGGLICLALEKEVAQALELPFYTDILKASGHPVSKMECTKTAYGDKPAFAIPVNHKKVYTGITDNDRALTIKKISELAELAKGVSHDSDGTNGERDAGPSELHKRFVRDFYSPGHVFLLIGRGIENRHGHTELTLELARRAGLPGAMVLCEMLGSGKALSREDARGYAERMGFAFIEGKDIWQE